MSTPFWLPVRGCLMVGSCTWLSHGGIGEFDTCICRSLLRFATGHSLLLIMKALLPEQNKNKHYPSSSTATLNWNNSFVKVSAITYCLMLINVRWTAMINNYNVINALIGNYNTDALWYNHYMIKTKVHYKSANNMQDHTYILFARKQINIAILWQYMS